MNRLDRHQYAILVSHNKYRLLEKTIVHGIEKTIVHGIQFTNIVYVCISTAFQIQYANLKPWADAQTFVDSFHFAQPEIFVVGSQLISSAATCLSWNVLCSGDETGKPDVPTVHAKLFLKSLQHLLLLLAFVA